MIDAALIDALRCPCCGSDMRFENNYKSLVCLGARKHCYDFSSSGYLNLSPNHSAGGDSKDAVRSRTEFLDSGAYAPVSDAVCEMLRGYLLKGARVLDAGCGEGYYSCRIADEEYNVLGFDLSKDAVNNGAKRAKREKKNNAFFGVASVYSLPVKDGCADAVVNIFAPCAEDEYCRVLKDGGIFAFVYAGEEHLMGLKRAIYDTVYENEERADIPKQMELIEKKRVFYEITLTESDQIQNLFSMTPYYWRTSLDDKKKLSGLESLTTEVDIIIEIYKKKDVI